MKKSFKKILIAGISLVSFLIPFLSYTPTYADCRTGFLGLNSWDCGVEEKPENEEQLKTNVIAIASNVLTDLTIISAYLVLGYVIYGGYLYMFSSGDANKASSGKKTLTNAFTGLGIVMLASVILGAIRIALLGNGSTLEANRDIDVNQLVTNLIQWVVGIAGVISAIFLVLGGISYLTSSGDSNKLQKAKSTILYALIGLVIVALAEIITAFVSGIIRDADTGQTTSYIETSITKELHEK